MKSEMKEIAKAKYKNALRVTLKLQPIVVLYSLVSVSSKLASKELPTGSEGIWELIVDCLLNKKLIAIYIFMMSILFY